MGNLFIGFPVPRAKIATMIETAAPPLEHYDNHLPDGSDPIVLPGDISDDQILQWNGTKFTGTDAPSEGVAEHSPTHEPDGADPLALAEDLGTDQLLQWNGTKFVGLDVPAAAKTLNPLSIHACQFNPVDDEKDYVCDQTGLSRRASLDSAVFWAPVLFPNAATVTRVTVYAFRDDASAPMSVYLYRVTNIGGSAIMAYISVDWTGGNSNKFDSSIDDPLIDNDTYSYCLRCYMNCNDSVDDLKLYRVKIDFT